LGVRFWTDRKGDILRRTTGLPRAMRGAGDHFYFAQRFARVERPGTIAAKALIHSGPE